MADDVYHSIGSRTTNIVSSENSGATAAMRIHLTVGHGFLVDEAIFITGHLLNTNANGNWRIGAITGANDEIIHLYFFTGAPRPMGAGAAGGATGTCSRTYTTISAWETATSIDLVTPQTKSIGEVYQDTVSDHDRAAGDAAISISGATVNASYHRMLKNGPGHRFNPIDLSGALIRKTQGNPLGSALDISEAFFHLKGIGVTVLENTSTPVTTGTHRGIDILASDVTLTSIWCKYAAGSGSSKATCFRVFSGARIQLLNCIAVGAGDPDFGAYRGFETFSGPPTTDGVKLLNCAAYGCAMEVSPAAASYGFRIGTSGGGSSIVNCIAIDNVNSLGTDFSVFSSSTWTNCISGDNSVSLQGSSYVDQYGLQVWVYPGGDDFRNRSTSVAIARGISFGSIFNTDFSGAPRGVYWDIGPYAGTASVPLTAPLDVIETIGSGGGYDYATIEDWETATRLHLISRNERRIGELYDVTDFNIASPGLTIGGAITDSRRYRMLRAADGHGYDLIEDVGVWIDGAWPFVIRATEDYFRIERVGIGNTVVGGASKTAALQFQSTGCIADGVFASVLAATASQMACFYGFNRKHQTWRNCIAHGSGDGSTGASWGFRALGNFSKIHNCVAYDIDGVAGTSFGVYTDDALTEIKNTIAADCDTGFGSSTAPLMDYCISSDGTALGSHSFTSVASSALFSGIAVNDLRVIRSSVAVNSGTALGAFFTTDFAGVSRTAPWEIGAYNGFASPLLAAAVEIGRCSALATCWLVERVDGVVMAFTDHSRDIDHNGEVFIPGGGFDQSNKRAMSNLRAANVEFRGAVTSDGVTFDDLWSKKYDGARVTEMLVNWRFPWTAPSTKNVYYVQEVSWTGEEWIVQIAAQPQRFTQPIGMMLSRDCRHQLGDVRCGFDVRALSQYAQVVTSIPTDRAIFRASALPSHTDEHYRFGRVEWITGNNAGSVSEVLRDTNTGREIEVQIPTFFEIQVGDTFDLIVGCSGLISDCNTKFDNVVNFGGDWAMPGADRLIQSPPR